MFDNIVKFFKKLLKNEQSEINSKDSAKERLHLVLMQDRANVSADFLDLMKQEIIEVIKKYIDVELKFDSPKVLGLHSIKRTFSRQILTSETKFYRGSLRSGQKLEFEGSIVIVGDVNGGAEVISGENIIIVGALRGLAHAGAKGNKKAIIAASRIDTPQIRIANLVKEMKKEENMCNKMYVYVQDNEIIID